MYIEKSMNIKQRQVMIMNKPVMKKGALKRLLKMLYESYPKLLVITLGFILFNAIIE